MPSAEKAGERGVRVEAVWEEKQVETLCLYPRGFEIIQKQKKTWTPEVPDKAICNFVTSMLFLTSSSYLLRHPPKGKAFVILNNQVLKCPE